MTDARTVKVDTTSRATVKVDNVEMQAEARRSMGLSGPPVSVTKDDEPETWRRLALRLLFSIAVTAGVFLARPDFFEPVRVPPPLPRVAWSPPAPVTLVPLALPPPTVTPPTPIKRSRRHKTAPPIAKPLFTD